MATEQTHHRLAFLFMMNIMGSISKAGFSSEESGWTEYFDDFFNNQLHKPSSSSLVNTSSSSLVSDATSLNLAANKNATNCGDDDETREDHKFSVSKNVSLRKRKRKRKKPQQAVHLIIHDDDVLQDTATSPLINSFKKKCGSGSDRKEMALKGRHST